MTYEAVEIGAVGSPVEMFLFQRRETCWQYTSSDAVQVLGSKTYLPRTISRGAFDRGDEAGSSTVTVRLDRVLKVVSQFLEGSTPTPVSLTIYRRHRTDGEPIVLFSGVVANAERLGEEVILTCVSPLSAEEKAIPRERIMRTCPHVLYGPRCTVDPTDYDNTATLTTPSGTHYPVTGMASTESGIYTAGVMVKNSTGQRAFIQKHSWSLIGGHDFWLLQPVAGWGNGDAVTVYEGCNRKHTTCLSRFDNMANFGGFPLHPERDPFISLRGD
jgi:uncharacterized phage protein (TIGR02218 family)